MAKKNKFKKMVYGNQKGQTPDKKQQLDKTSNSSKETVAAKNDEDKTPLSKRQGMKRPQVDKPMMDTNGQHPKNAAVLQHSGDKSSPKLQLRKKPDKGSHDTMESKDKLMDSALRKNRIKDTKLIPRIREYLESRTNASIVSIPLLAEYLQKKYLEYSRRKRGVFTTYIEKAYAIMDKQQVSSNQSSSSEEPSECELDEEEQGDTGKPRVKRRKVLNYDDDADCFVEEEVLVDYKDTNAINNLMTNMYKSSPQHSAGQATETPESESYLSFDPHRMKHNYDGPKDPRKYSEDCYFIDKKGDQSGDDRTTREETIQKFMGGLPARTSFVNSGKDPRLHRVYTVGEKVVRDPHGGITLDNTGTSIDPPSSPTPDKQMDIDEIIIDSDIEETTSIKSVKGDRIKDKDSSTPRRGKKQKQVTSKAKRNKEDTASKDKNEDGPALQMSTVTFADVGGNEQSLVEICKMLVHMRHPEVYQQLGVTPPRGFLLHGPPGCGKTLLANAIAGELELPMIKIAATEVVSGVSGDSEEKVRDLFDMAMRSAPCILFIDEVDAITPKRETASKDMERRIVSQLLTCMDDLSKNTEAHVLVIGATNRPDSLDPALRRAGRFDKEICLGIPDEASRKRILEVLCRNLRLNAGFDFSYLAKFSPGYVGADLMSLTREAAMVAVNRVFKDLQTSVECRKTAQSEISKKCQENSMACDKSMEINTSETTHTDSGSVPNTSGELISGVNDTTNHSILNQSGTVVEEPIVESKDKVVDGNKVLSSTTGDLTVSDSQSTLVVCANEVNSQTGDSDNTEDTGLSSENVDTAKDVVKFVDSKNSEDPFIQELYTVLSWLKDQPPLTEDQLRGLYVTMDDFKEALKTVQPSSKREGFVTVPDVTWNDIGALHNVREELQLAILAPVRHPEEFKALGLNRAQGILLAGPPGCGKTLLAKAVANESGINFISVKGPELLNMYVGESEKAVRTVFQRARNSSPCVIFFDELDALCPRRSGNADGGSSSRVVNQLLTEMDGLEDRKQVFIMAATNRPDIIDPAVLRPGRLDKTLYVGLPSLTDRLDILLCLTKNGTKPLLSSDVNMNTIAADQRCENYTGADIAALVREASVAALKEAISKPNRILGEPIAVDSSHFEMAFKKIKPSVSDKDREKYINMGCKLAVD